MLIKALTLENFRQFQGKVGPIEFAQDGERNVTVVLGDNGTGKTSLAQAFTWCLYGETEFSDKEVFNRAIAEAMAVGEKAVTVVMLDFEHNGTVYGAKRKQEYKKDGKGKLKSVDVSMTLTFKRSGQTEFVKDLEIDPVLRSILPKEMARYFFFDGERIGSMGKEIRRGKSQEFATAVRSILGLGALLKAIEHLKPNSKNSVIGKYDQQFDEKSNEKMKVLGSHILSRQSDIDGLDEQLKILEKEIAIADDNSEELSKKLSTNAESEQLQKRKGELLLRLSGAKQSRSMAIGMLLRTFCNSLPSYLSSPLAMKVQMELEGAEKADKGIPEMHAKSVDYLIKRGRCVCGTKIEPGSEAYIELMRAIEYLPPASIGVSIAQFTKESEVRISQAATTRSAIAEHYKMVRTHENQETEISNDIKLIEDRLIGMESVADMQRQLTQYEERLTEFRKQRDVFLKKKGVIESERDRAETERSELALKDKSNRKVQIYKEYATALYSKLSTVYLEQEKLTRTRLISTINELFKKIYSGGLSIAVDEDYNIEVVADAFSEFGADVETSTAQGISVIFAFLAGIIQMARDGSSAIEQVGDLLTKEPYPLVMDAPLSAFDKKRIKTVCEVLPNAAEQVIVFIKDTDGEIAEGHMSKRIGKRYSILKKTEYQSYVEELGHV